MRNRELNITKKEAIDLIQTAADDAKSLIELARLEALRATDAANGLIEKAQIEAAKVLGVAQAQAQAQGQGQGLQARYVDLSRIPLICQSIIDIKILLQEIKASFVSQVEFKPIKNMVFGLVAMILVSFIASVMVLVFK